MQALLSMSSLIPAMHNDESCVKLHAVSYIVQCQQTLQLDDLKVLSPLAFDSALQCCLSVLPINAAFLALPFASV